MAAGAIIAILAVLVLAAGVFVLFLSGMSWKLIAVAAVAEHVQVTGGTGDGADLVGTVIVPEPAPATV